MKTISIVIPAKNEAGSLVTLLPELRRLHPDAEIIVVDDGSTDGTRAVAETHANKVVHHPYSKGNGAAIKSGARAATGQILVFMDADGQHQPSEIQALLKQKDTGYDMVVGARKRSSQATAGRWLANSLYNRIASYVVGHKVQDLTSGFRAVDAEKFRDFLHFLPNGFSYPTTITMAFFRSGYSVSFMETEVLQRDGQSHIHPLKDGIRFLLIIFKIGTLYSPLKMFFPVSAALFATGLSYYLYTYFTVERFTNMSALLMLAGIITFLVGLISEQITMLMYSEK